MGIPIISNVVNGIKGGLKATLQGTADTGSVLANSVKNVAVTTLKGTGELVIKGVIDFKRLNRDLC
ncbi:hypothetical protein ACFOUP_07685 [Belliella kenyensis]|uniref:Uncharacterized protein n=1 Tax=Belliella kenyensis TaxID=1472724 RepID=A0ABV8EJQ6_9BACT|nr:hypothetical protein [Belliella kenyensis]MCH7400355.1 hypothetical protein [Belliella kenyensis]MDN3604627.1 hypothetical protein [Belliella kenyensis]